MVRTRPLGRGGIGGSVVFDLRECGGMLLV